MNGGFWRIERTFQSFCSERHWLSKTKIHENTIFEILIPPIKYATDNYKYNNLNITTDNYKFSLYEAILTLCIKDQKGNNIIININRL